MIVRKLAEIEGTERETNAENWTSRRLLLKSDGMGFSMHDTLLYAGTTTEMEYQNHLEAVYCIEGKGLLKDLTNGVEYPLEPGTIYALSGHERHIVIAQEQLRMVCVFNPPIVGSETHDADGVYPLLE